MSEKAIYAILGLGIIGIFIIIIAGITSLVLYILNSYALYMILKAVGYELAWLAWIPCCQYFAITMAFNYKNEQNISVFGIPIPRPAAGFASLIGAIIASIIPVVGGFFPLLALLINGNILGEMFDVCEDSEPGKNIGMGIISALIVFVQIFMLFNYMKKANDGEIDIQRYAASH